MDADFGNIDFFFERITKHREYIYYSIYTPILDFNNAVANHMWHFRWHLDGSGKNDTVMLSFVTELQDYLLERTGKSLPTEFDETGKAISFCYYTATQPKLVHDIRKELNGYYYEIMYGKRTARKAQNETLDQEEKHNGENENGVR